MPVQTLHPLVSHQKLANKLQMPQMTKQVGLHMHRCHLNILMERLFKDSYIRWFIAGLPRRSKHSQAYCTTKHVGSILQPFVRSEAQTLVQILNR